MSYNVEKIHFGRTMCTVSRTFEKPYVPLSQMILPPDFYTAKIRQMLHEWLEIYIKPKKFKILAGKNSKLLARK